MIDPEDGRGDGKTEASERREETVDAGFLLSGKGRCDKKRSAGQGNGPEYVRPRAEGADVPGKLDGTTPERDGRKESRPENHCGAPRPHAEDDCDPKKEKARAGRMGDERVARRPCGE